MCCTPAARRGAEACRGHPVTLCKAVGARGHEADQMIGRFHAIPCTAWKRRVERIALPHLDLVPAAPSHPVGVTHEAVHLMPGGDQLRDKLSAHITACICH
jgi:hypothetical protein